MTKRKEIFFIVLVTLFSLLLCGCSLTNDRKACTLSYDDYLNIVQANNYDVSEYELSLESYPVKQIDVKKGKNFTASYQIFSSSQAVDDIYKNTKKYYARSCDLKEEFDNGVVFQENLKQVTIIKSNKSILTMEDSTDNFMQTEKLLNLAPN